MPIFNNYYDYSRFVKTMTYYMLEGPKPKFSIFTPTTTFLDSTRKIVSMLCYCLMPNHFHFLIQQKKKGGITEFVSKISNSYTKFFNTKYKRVGPLLQGQFKAVLIEKNEQLLHITRYIHLNPIVSYLIKDLETYKWSSYTEYISKSSDQVCAKEIILDQFSTIASYKEFLNDQIDYAKQLEILKHQLLDEEN